MGPSSSANSFTFHGYKVVIDISAACKLADKMKSANQAEIGNISEPWYTGGVLPFVALLAKPKAVRHPINALTPKIPKVCRIQRRSRARHDDCTTDGDVISAHEDSQ